jgi:adenosylhomocysteine nucleosidase
MFFRRTLPRRRAFLGAPAPAVFHGDGSRIVLVVETGVGAAAMEKAMSWLLAGPPLDGGAFRPSLVLSAGFSGAVVPGLSVGDLILAEDLAGVDGVSWPATWPKGSTSFRRGRLLTASSLVSRPEEKRRLGEESGAIAVDMESAVAARLCSAAGLPFGCLRAISDDVDTPMSEALLAVLAGGRVKAGRLTMAILRRPWLIAELLRLAIHTRHAAKRLAIGLTELLASSSLP